MSEPVPPNEPDRLVSGDVSETETVCDSSVAAGSSSSGPDHGMGEPGSDSSSDLYMMASDSGSCESNSDVTLAVDNAFEKLEKAYRALRRAVRSRNRRFRHQAPGVEHLVDDEPDVGAGVPRARPVRVVSGPFAAV